MQEVSRISIADQARFIAAFPDRNTLTEIKEVSSDWQKWAIAKPEMYAICAVLGNDIVNRALGNLAGPASIAEVVSKPDRIGTVPVFENLFAYTKKTLSEALEVEYKAAMQTPRKSLWERYEELNRLSQVIREARRRGSRLQAGLNTAAATMADILKVITYIPQEGSEDTQKLTEMARNSYPLIAQLAMLHIKDFTWKEDWLRQDEEYSNRDYNPAKFIIVETKNGLALAIDEQLHSESSSSEEPRIGCPGMVRVDGASAIRKLWDWHVMVAPEVYRVYLKTLGIIPDYSKMDSRPINDLCREWLAKLKREED